MVCLLIEGCSSKRKIIVDIEKYYFNHEDAFLLSNLVFLQSWSQKKEKCDSESFRFDLLAMEHFRDRLWDEFDIVNISTSLFGSCCTLYRESMTEYYNSNKCGQNPLTTSDKMIANTFYIYLLVLRSSPWQIPTKQDKIKNDFNRKKLLKSYI